MSYIAFQRLLAVSLGVLAGACSLEVSRVPAERALQPSIFDDNDNDALSTLIGKLEREERVRRMLTIKCAQAGNRCLSA